jgi:hypothetical protein
MQFHQRGAHLRRVNIKIGDSNPKRASESIVAAASATR